MRLRSIIQERSRHDSSNATSIDYFMNRSPQFTLALNCSSPIALLVTPEYEGIFRNGGIGTYYATLSRKLADRGWSIILLLCQTSETFSGHSDISHISHIFSTSALETILDLQPVHTAILSQFKAWQWVESDSYRSLLFIQALLDRYPDLAPPLYVEFPDLCGLGYRSIQAKKAGLLGQNCTIAVTLHSPQEWLNEAHERFTLGHSDWFRNIYEYEQYAFENADLAFFLSCFLKSKVESYGWHLDHAMHLPYCFPLIDPTERSPQPINSATLDIDRKAIPIIFFGRLEERKGLLTFLAAIRQLAPDLRERLHLLFLGKSVPLHTPHLQPLTSRDYIAQELGQDFTYSIMTDLFSQTAIALVRDLAPAIVCLASHQENLPNTAFEMGQLSVSLVVSDTGGFRESLNLIQRSAGLYWFQPGSAIALAQALSAAIVAYPEQPTVPNINFLAEVNHSLLEQRLQVMEYGSISKIPSTITSPTNFHQSPLLGMTSSHEQEFLRNYAQHNYSGQGEIVDLGCWLGSATIALAQGLEHNERNILKFKRIHAYDLFEWDTYMNQSVRGTELENRYQAGDSFLEEYLHRISPWQYLIKVYPGDLMQIGWRPRKQIEYLFVDAMKSWELAKYIFKEFFPHLIPGISLVHHNDFAHFYTGWIHLLMYKLKNYLVPVNSLWNAAVFRYIQPLPMEIFQKIDLNLPLSIFSKSDIDAAFDYSSEITCEEVQPNIAAAKAMFWVHLGDLQTAKEELNQARNRFGEVLEIPLVMQEIARREGVVSD